MKRGRAKLLTVKKPFGGVIYCLMECLILSGCASMKVPLCPKLAIQSYAPPRPGTVINKYLADEAQKKKVTVVPLSAFVARVAGRRSRVKSIEKDYPFMLCAFEPLQVPNTPVVYEVCMQYAPNWMQIVQSKKPEDLMGPPETHYSGVCVP